MFPLDPDQICFWRRAQYLISRFLSFLKKRSLAGMKAKQFPSKIVFLGIVFLAALASGIFWSKSGVKHREKVAAQLLDCDPNDVRKIELTESNRGQIILERTDAAADQAFKSQVTDLIQWQMREPRRVEADAGKVSKLVGMLCHTYNPEKISDQEKQGVSFNGTTVRIWEKADEQPVELQFSPKVVQRRGYVRVGDSGAAYRVSEALFRVVSVPADFLENRKIARIVPSNVLRLRVWAKEKEAISMERNDDGWLLKRGEKILGNGSEEAERYVNRIVTLNALSLVAEHTVCQKAPDFRLELGGVSGRKEELKFFFYKDGMLGCNSDRSDTFLVHRDFAKYLSISPKKLM